jgi:hypothetical protein
MKEGDAIVRGMKEVLLERHEFSCIDEFRGRSLEFFTGYANLVEMQLAARVTMKSDHDRIKTIRADAEWDGDDFVQPSDALSRA